MAPRDYFNLPDYITSNRPVTEEEKEKAIELSDEAKGHLVEVWRKMDEFNAQVNVLWHQEADLMETIELCQSTFAPIRQLPEDIIRAIFMLCLDTTCSPSMSRREAPVLLTHISSAMRRIALETPALWTSFYLPVVDDTSKGGFYSKERRSIMIKRAEALNEWIENRSGGLPLSISICEYDDVGPCAVAETKVEDQHTIHTANRSDSGVKAISNVLVNCSSRWKELSITLSDVSDEFLAIHSILPSQIPLLQSISLDLIAKLKVHNGAIFSFKKSNILGAPNVKEFKLSTSSHTIHPSNYSQINWLNITHFAFRGKYRPRDAHPIQHVFPCAAMNLVSCYLGISYKFGSFILDCVELPSLKKLAIDDSSPHLEILHSIEAPALEQFAYNMEGDLDPDDLPDFLARSTNIRDLSLGQEISVSYLLGCLEQCPSLTKLTTKSISDDDGFDIMVDLLDRFTDHNDDVDYEPDESLMLCPKLEYFCLYSELSVAPSHLREFVARKNGSKSPTLSRWKGIVLNVGELKQRTDAAVYEALSLEVEKDGLDLKVSYTLPSELLFPVTFPLQEGITYQTIIRKQPTWWDNVVNRMMQH